MKTKNSVKGKVDFSQWTANNFMQVAREFSNRGSLNNLNQTKIFALLAVPKEEREAFVEENPVEDMTTRELQQAIKEKKAIEEEKENIQEQMDKLAAEMQALKNLPRVAQPRTGLLNQTP